MRPSTSIPPRRLHRRLTSCSQQAPDRPHSAPRHRDPRRQLQRASITVTSRDREPPFGATVSFTSIKTSPAQIWVFCAGRPGRRGLGGEAFDDCAGCLGAGAACFVAVDRYWSASTILASALASKHTAATAGRFRPGRRWFFHHVFDRLRPSGPEEASDLWSDAALDQGSGRVVGGGRGRATFRRSFMGCIRVWIR